jgi:two-component system, OmpR family, KDP operon response regulator KdpE
MMTQTEPQAATPRLLLLGEEPLLHALLHGRLGEAFDVSGKPGGHAEALAMARAADVNVILIDADLKDADPSEVVAGIAMVCAAPLVALSAAASPGSPAAAALFLAGARAVVHKPAGRLPLDLGGGFGQSLIGALHQAALA